MRQKLVQNVLVLCALAALIAGIQVAIRWITGLQKELKHGRQAIMVLGKLLNESETEPYAHEV